MGLANFFGYVALHRSLLNWEWHSEPATGWLFVNLILLANHAPAEWKGIKIDRGQLITGRKALAEQTGLSEQSIRTALNHLKSTGEITIRSTNRFSLITVVNYDKFQGFRESSTSASTKFLTNGQPATHHKQKGKEGETGFFGIADAPATKETQKFVPPTVDEVRRYCEEQHFGVDAEEFVDCNISRGWMIGKSKMVDWKASVRCWEKKGYGRARKTEMEDPYANYPTF